MKPWILLSCLASPAVAASGGNLGTIPAGNYICEVPGDAAGPAGIRQPAADFAVTNGSSYSAAGQTGTYLLAGDTLVFTSGPHKGQRFRVTGTRTLHRIDSNGRPGSLRCVNNG